MTKLHHKFNREAERKKESEFLFWWLVALLLLQSTFPACTAIFAVQHGDTEFQADLKNRSETIAEETSDYFQCSFS